MGTFLELKKRIKCLSTTVLLFSGMQRAMDLTVKPNRLQEIE